MIRNMAVLSSLTYKKAFNTVNHGILFQAFGTHSFYQGGGGGGSSRSPSHLKNLCPHEPEILQGIRDTFESLRNVKVVNKVFTWLP